MTKVILLGEARGEAEAKISRGFVGASGIELLRMLNESGVIEFTTADYDFLNRYYDSRSGKGWDPRLIDCIWNLHPELHRANVFDLHPPGNKIEAFCGPKTEALPGYPALIKGKFVRKEFAPQLERLGDELLEQDPTLIIALGNTALWAMLGNTGISKLRGTTCYSTHTVSGFKLLPTYHPAAVLRQWELRPTTVADLMKASREKDYAEIRRPRRSIWIDPTIPDIRTFVETYCRNCEMLSVDIETSGTRITCIGFAPSPDVAIVIPFDGPKGKGRAYWPTKSDEVSVWAIVRGVLEDRGIKKVFQNGLYDIAFLWRAYGIRTFGASEDTMLLHHALQPESLKGLGFLGSVYTDEGSWKHMRTKHETIKRDD